MLCQLASFLSEHDALTEFYATNLRPSLFSGFMTLAGFLFTVKSFLIARLNQDVYSDPDYQDWIEDTGKRYNPSLTVYGSLKRLGRVLFVTLCLAFTTAIAQFTVGLSGQRWGTWLAMGLAMTTVLVFGWTLFIVRGAIQAWVVYLEDKMAKRRAKDKADAAAANAKDATAV